jgi:hypothetical protein
LKEGGASAFIFFEARFSVECLAVSTPVIGPSNLLFLGGGGSFSAESRLVLVCSGTPRISCLCRHPRVSQPHFEAATAAEEEEEEEEAEKEEEEEQEEEEQEEGEGEQHSMSLAGEGSEDDGRLASHLPI